MSSVKEEEITEPDLVYFKPVSNPEHEKPESLLMPNYAIRNPPHQHNPPFLPHFHPFLQSQAAPNQPQPESSGSCYPHPSTLQPYTQNQQRGTRDYLHLYPTSDGFQSLMASDSLFQEEVTHAAKTLFSKRNRTLLHWLYPGVSKGQLKIDVNTAWNSLPERERLFYISQVLGKFAPHTTSLMVNPQLEPNSQSLSSDSDFTTTENTGMTSKKKDSKKHKNVTEKRNIILLSDEDISRDSGLVVDIDAPKAKRKYNKRTNKEKMVKINNYETELRASSTEIADSTVSDQQKTTDLASQSECESKMPDLLQQQDKKDISRKKQKKESIDCTVPRVKRKYIKRKLVRKKYTRKKPLKNILDDKTNKNEDICENGSESFTPKGSNSEEEMDIFIDLDTDMGFEDFNLLNEEVDSFWDSIEDPNNLFKELEME